MDEFDLNNAPNPFSVFADQRGQSRRRLLAAGKLFGLVVLAMGLSGLGHEYWKRNQTNSLLSDFSLQPPTERMQRLGELDARDPQAMKALVSAIADPNDAVSENAFQQSTQELQSWTTLPAELGSKQRVAFAAQLRSLAATFSKMEDGPAKQVRLQRLAKLAQTLAQFELSSPKAQPKPYADAMQAMELAHHQTRDTVTETPSMHKPLPIDSLNNEWSQWPPEPTNSPQLYRKRATVLGQAETSTQQTEPALVRPSYQSAAEVSPPQPTPRVVQEINQLPTNLNAPQEYWAAQLKSPSRLVRLRAVKELEQLIDDNNQQRIRDLLLERLRQERDQTVASRIRQLL